MKRGMFKVCNFLSHELTIFLPVSLGVNKHFSGVSKSEVSISNIGGLQVTKLCILNTSDMYNAVYIVIYKDRLVSHWLIRVWSKGKYLKSKLCNVRTYASWSWHKSVEHRMHKFTWHTFSQKLSLNIRTICEFHNCSMNDTSADHFSRWTHISGQIQEF